MIFGTISLVSCNGAEDEPKKPDTDEPVKPVDPTDPTDPTDPEKPVVPTLPKELCKQWKLHWSQQYDNTLQIWPMKSYASSSQLLTLNADSTLACTILGAEERYYRWMANGDTLSLEGVQTTQYKFVIEDNVLTINSLDGLSRMRLRDNNIPPRLDPLLFGSWLLDSLTAYDVKGEITQQEKVEYRQTMNLKANGSFVEPRIWGTDSMISIWKTEALTFYHAIPEQDSKKYEYQVITREGKRIFYQSEYLFDDNQHYVGYQVLKFDEYQIPDIVGRWELLHLQPYKKSTPFGEPQVPQALLRQFFDVEGGYVQSNLISGEESYGYWSVKDNKLTLTPEDQYGQPDPENAIKRRYKMEGAKLLIFEPAQPGIGYDELASVYVVATE